MRHSSLKTSSDRKERSNLKEELRVDNLKSQIKPCSWLTPMLAVLGLCAALGQSATGPEVLRATLTNGLSVIIVRNTLAPVVTTVINYRVGSDECPPGFPGTAH